jgi:uncharacterized protein YfaA (DUF2138 family)
MTPEVTRLVELVGQRYGIYFGKRIVQGDVFKATSTERTEMRTINKEMDEKIGAYLDSGTDVREDVKALVSRRVNVKMAMKEKSKPFSPKLSELGTTLSYLDKVAVPQAYQKATGRAIIPITEVPADLKTAASKKGE